VGSVPQRAAGKADQSQTRCTVSGAADQMVGAAARACAKPVRKRLAWCMIRARPAVCGFMGHSHIGYEQNAGKRDGESR